MDNCTAFRGYRKTTQNFSISSIDFGYGYGSHSKTATEKFIYCEASFELSYYFSMVY